MAVPPGTAAVVLAPYSAPAFTAATVANGATITTVTLENTLASPITNHAFTFGHAFKKGTLTPADSIVGKLNGADVPLQWDVKATHADGSVRHAIISGILPALVANGTVTMALVRSTAAANHTPTTTASLVSAGFSASVDFVVGGITYTAATGDMAAAFNWLAGPIATEFILNQPFKDGSGAAHPMLTAQFCVRYYPGANTARVDVVVENTKAYESTGDVQGDVTIKVAGNTVYNKTGVYAYQAARWKRQFWWGQVPSLHIKHNIPYLIETKAVANYDQRITVAEAKLESYATQLGTLDFGPNGAGPWRKDMSATGGRPDIGPAPEFYAATILTMDKRAKAYSLAAADAAGTFPGHRRDTSTGPGTGRPLSVIYFPCASINGNLSDTKNGNTGLYEKLPARSTVSGCELESSHQPAFAYVPYLLTGDYYYLEEVQFYANYYTYFSNPGYRNYFHGLVSRDQVRAQAWGMRNLAEAAYIVPDGDLSKPAYMYWISENLTNYNTNLTDNASANPLGIMDIGGYTYIYKFINDNVDNTGLAPWQDDFFTQAIGRTAELGFSEAGRLLKWKAKFQVGRMLAPGYCWVQASIFKLRVRDTAASSIYSTLSECLSKSVVDNAGTIVHDASLYALPCGSQTYLDKMNAMRAMPSNPFLMNEMVGYAYSSTGYPANFQPALAYAVDSGYTDADLAWSLFDSRATQPDYYNSPQFAIVPRPKGVQAPIMIGPVDTYSVASGQPIYAGKAAPTPPPLFDALTFTDLSGTPWAAQDGKVLVVELHGSSGSNNNTGRQYTATVSGNMSFTGQNSFGFSVVAAGGVAGSPAGGSSYYVKLRPIDKWTTETGAVRESNHKGFLRPDGKFYLISEHRYDAMLAWADTNLIKYNLAKRVLTGGSMGGWGTISYGVPRYSKFAALYADRPRWRYGYTVGTVSVPVWAQGWVSYPVDISPVLVTEDGGKTFYAYSDMIAYISNPANKVRWIGWCVGRQDGYATFDDQIAAVDAMRATKRGFAFIWNNGDHAGGSQMTQITQSYPFGTFEIGKGYPLFTDHSLDQDPRIDLVGGINIGLSFRNVIETVNGWSCEITNVLNACTVKVEPISDIFKAPVAKQTITIPAANTWVLVTFNA